MQFIAETAAHEIILTLVIYLSFLLLLVPLFTHSHRAQNRHKLVVKIAPRTRQGFDHAHNTWHQHWHQANLPANDRGG